MSRQRQREPDEPSTQTPADSAALHATDLQLGYGEEIVVDLDTLVIPRGEVTALVGPNGSGKSTLLKGFAAELEPENGSVLLHGRSVHERTPKDLARELGLLDQENTAPGDLTVESLVTHGRYLRVLLASLLDEYGLRDMHRLDHANTCVNRVVHVDGTFRADLLNCTAHLEAG